MLQSYSQFVTFLFVGTLNTACGYALFAFFLFMGCHYMVAALLSTCLGVLINFQTTGKIVFKNKNNRLLMHFIGVHAVLYFWNISLIKIIHLWVTNLYLAGAIATVFMAFTSFYLNKRFVFVRKSS